MKTERHNFDLGDIVTVFNRTLGGKFIIEGRAAIVKLHDAEDFYQVRFLHELTQYRRYIDPNGQEDPQAYLKILNDWTLAGDMQNA